MAMAELVVELVIQEMQVIQVMLGVAVAVAVVDYQVPVAQQEQLLVLLVMLQHPQLMVMVEPLR
jgi:hypothetical protein